MTVSQRLRAAAQTLVGIAAFATPGPYGTDPTATHGGTP
jgi:hypothetical protein